MLKAETARQDGQETDDHLVGGHVFAAMADEDHDNSTKLSHAAWWIHQRQDVYRAVYHQSPTRTEVDLDRLRDLADPSDVYSWVRRAQALAGEVVDFCFGSAPQSLEMHTMLKDRLQEWHLYSPTACAPLYYNDRDVSQGRPFPEIRFALNSSCQYIGHRRLAR